MDKIAYILTRSDENQLGKESMKDLIFVIPKISPFEFQKLCGAKGTARYLRTLRNKILGISDDYILSMEDIDQRVEEATGKPACSLAEARSDKIKVSQ